MTVRQSLATALVLIWVSQLVAPSPLGGTSRAKANEHRFQKDKEQMSEPKLHEIESNGIRMRLAELGSGPLVVLLHGWPESWYSWRYQLPALAQAGYRAVAPDMRGFGRTEAPDSVDAYDIVHLTADVVGILDALGEENAVVVGHDWGSIVAWHCALLHPDRFGALVAMSVPYGGRPKESPIATWQRQFGDDFFYILYFQQPGVAEAEFDQDPRGILSRLYTSPDTPREKPELTDSKMAAGGWIKRLGAPKQRPDWLASEDLDYYVNEFSRAGFRGGINYYRNFGRNWEITEQLAKARVRQPTLFIAGDKDMVIRGADAGKLRDLMGRATDDLRGVELFAETGHWVQQERPVETNRALIEFLKTLD